MKVIQALGWYFPESSGGSEVYVDRLAYNLARRGIHSVVAAASDGATATDYFWNDVPVHRYFVPQAPSEEIRNGTPHLGFDAFEAWLRTQQADVYHQHSWTRGCGLHHLGLAKALGFKTILTVHVPNVVCLRGTMMLDGLSACDGRVDIERCTQCWGTSRGIPGTVAAWQSHNTTISQTLGRILPDSRLRTALVTPHLVARHQDDLAMLGHLADRVVAVCRWLYDALILNGIPPEKVVYCPQGVDLPSGFQRRPESEARHRTVRFGFLGRWDPVKGIHIIVEAFRRLPGTIDAELIIHAMPGDASYEESVRAQANGDQRIHFAAPIARDDVFRTLADFDVLTVPSQWLETGPLVVLEALAAGTPVIGSDLGGIAELVVPGVNGWLLPPRDVDAWTGALLKQIESTPLRPAAPRRSVSGVAEDMADLYRDVSEHRQSTATAQGPWTRNAS